MRLKERIEDQLTSADDDEIELARYISTCLIARDIVIDEMGPEVTKIRAKAFRKESIDGVRRMLIAMLVLVNILYFAIWAMP